MRIYLKILSITTVIQIAGVVVCYFLDFLLKSQQSSTILPFCIGFAFVVISTLLGVILPILWRDKLLHKIITILLLPTNYTVILGIIFVMKFLRQS